MTTVTAQSPSTEEHPVETIATVKVPIATETEEGRRLLETHGKLLWRRWGPYVSERSWGTVREDYSPNGAAWDFLSHDMARSKAYRWGEDGLAAICDRYQLLVFSLALWNGKDAILKERIFCLTPSEGNHGEDAKEYYFYLDSTPTHSYIKYLYKYPQAKYPYEWLLEENRKRCGKGFEFELIDTGIFDEDRYFDVFVEYSKASAEDLCVRIEAVNRGPDAAPLHIIPQLWFRNTWAWADPPGATPVIVEGPHAEAAVSLVADDTSGEQLKNLPFEYQLGARYLYAQADGKALFTDNETNGQRLYGVRSANKYFKDAFHRAIVNGEQEAVNPAKRGTKACLHYEYIVPAGGSVDVRLRLTPEVLKDPLKDVYQIIAQRRAEADEFYAAIHPPKATDDEKSIQRQAFAGLLWTKQVYLFDVNAWFDGDNPKYPPPGSRTLIRNRHWRHLNSMRVLHSHADHTASLPMFVENAWTPAENCPRIYGSPETLDCVRKHIFNGVMWPDFVTLSRNMAPYLHLCPIQPEVPVQADGLEITAVPVHHVVPTVGYVVSDGESAVIFGGDSGPTDRLWEVAHQTPGLHAVFLEACFPDTLTGLAKVSLHLTAKMFAGEVAKIPAGVKIVAVHIKVRYREQVIRELHDLRLPNLVIGECEKEYRF